MSETKPYLGTLNQLSILKSKHITKKQTIHKYLNCLLVDGEDNGVGPAVPQSSSCKDCLVSSTQSHSFFQNLPTSLPPVPVFTTPARSSFLNPLSSFFANNRPLRPSLQLVLFSTKPPPALLEMIQQICHCRPPFGPHFHAACFAKCRDPRRPHGVF